MSWREIAEWDWVLLDDGDDLHAVRSVDADHDLDMFGPGVTECGRHGILDIPGVFTRMSASTVRCPECCAVTGMPQGSQSPKNVDACRPVCEARIASLLPKGPRMREPREFEVVSCFDCGYVGNRVDVVKDVIPGDGWPEVEINHCVECGEACGAWIKVREVLPEGTNDE